MTVNAVVAATQEEADRLVAPNLLAMLALRTGGRLAPQLLVEDAEKQQIPPEHESLAKSMLDRWIVGSPDAAAEVRALATTYAVDEVMLHPVAGAHIGTPTDRSPTREDTLRLLADALG